MSKQFLADNLQKSLKNITGVAALQAADDLMAAIVTDLLENNSFLLARFGTFKIHETKARPAMNPRTGEKISVPASFTVRFKPSPVLKNKVIEAMGGVPRPSRRSKKAADPSSPKGKPGRPAKAVAKTKTSKTAPAKVPSRKAASAKKPPVNKAPVKAAPKPKAPTRAPKAPPPTKKARTAKKSK